MLTDNEGTVFASHRIDREEAEALLGVLGGTGTGNAGAGAQEAACEAVRDIEIACRNEIRKGEKQA